MAKVTVKGILCLGRLVMKLLVLLLILLHEIPIALTLVLIAQILSIVGQVLLPQSLQLLLVLLKVKIVILLISGLHMRVTLWYCLDLRLFIFTIAH